MNINDFKQHLQHIHGTLDDDPSNKQMKDRLQENSPKAIQHHKKMHTQMAFDKPKQSTVPATTLASSSLKPNESSKKKEKLQDSVEYEQVALEYFENYFGDSLNENTSDEDILTAVEELVELCNDVCDAVGLEEAFPREVSTGPGYRAVREPASKSGYLTPSPEQLKTAIAKKADNSPLLITKGRDSFEGKPYTKAIRPSDVRDAAKAKRMKKMKKFKMK